MLLLGTSGFKPETKKKLGNNSPVLLLFGTSLKGSLSSLWCKNKITSENSKFDNVNPEVLRFVILWFSRGNTWLLFWCSQIIFLKGFVSGVIEEKVEWVDPSCLAFLTY